MNNKETYRRICEAEGDRIPLFQQYWWWDTVCATKPWDVLISKSNGNIKGSMPYLDCRKMGLRYSLMPQLTMFTGPWLADPADSSTLHDLYSQLLALRPIVYVGRLSPAMSSGDYGISDFKFQVSTHYTYRFDPIRPLDELMAGASQLRRRDYHRLNEVLTIDTNVAPCDFADLHAAYIASKRKQDLLPHEFIVRTCTAAIERQHGLIVGARAADRTLKAALFTAYDAECAYMLMLARSTDAPRNAMAFLIWRTIELMSRHSRIFDFEGSMEPGVEEYYSSFGAKRTDMLQLTLNRLPFIKI